LDTRFIDQFSTQLAIKLHYSAIADFHRKTLSVFPKRFLVTAANNGYSSASGLKSSLYGGSNTASQMIVRITTQFIISYKLKEMVRSHRATVSHM
jgi:hypothetical protein